MGDMADYALEQVETMEIARLSYHKGDLSDVEAYELGIIDELGYEIVTPKPKTCRCCGKTGLHWDQKDGKWRLFDNRGIHNCPVNPIKPKP